MPNNYGNYVVVPNLSDPLNMEPIRRREGVQPQPPANAESVLSRYHPANNPRRSEGSNNNYTFRQRMMKLNLTLGWELEANHVPMRIPAGVEHISDGSVDDDGAEFVVLPAVTKSPRYVLGLLKDLVHAPKLNTNKSCGFHVHVSASNLSSLARMRQWAIATEHLALQVEDLAFKAVPDSRHGNSYCRRIVPLTHGTSFNAHKYNNSRRYHWLNIVEMFRPGGIRTIEIRLLGNTHRWKYLLAWTLFSMELARRGWDIANKPFDVAGHVDALGQMLIKIEKEIKPLDKKAEPIPQWVYDGLKAFDLGPDAWERPLARLAETEDNLRGLAPRWYSDNQPEMPTRRRDEDNEDSCACGCGSDGRCSDQEHDDGDCDSAYCERCHSNGDCQGLPDCDRCIDDAHENGDSCQRRICATCHPQPRVNRPSSGTVTGRVSTSSGPVSAEPSLTAESMRQAAERLRNEPVRSGAEAMLRYTMQDAGVTEAMRTMIHGSVLYGTHTPPRVWVDEASHINVSVAPLQVAAYSAVYDPAAFGQTFVEPTQETERRAYAMLDEHEQALSADRDLFYFTRGGR